MAFAQPCPNERATAAELLDAASTSIAHGMTNAKAMARDAILAARAARLNAMALGELPTLP